MRVKGKKFSSPSAADLDAIITNICAVVPRQQGLVVQRVSVLHSLRRVDPVMSALRNALSKFTVVGEYCNSLLISGRLYHQGLKTLTYFLIKTQWYLVPQGQWILFRVFQQPLSKNWHRKVFISFFELLGTVKRIYCKGWCWTYLVKVSYSVKRLIK